ncbi:MAG: 50S ribosomal protein L11 methyltransferase [Alphaproteobacteria bacterium]|nr:50S ribosomal protein L11 methyltransferase [Alphaproteobacteria bacterium]
MRIEYHRTLIADHVRNEVLFEALKAVIVPGQTTVADIGAGTGLLGLMAAKLGAKEVYLYETAEVSGVAEAVIEASGFENCFLMPCHSMEMHEPPTVDVIISETLGNYAFEEDMIATLNDARGRFLRPGGVILPRAVRQFAAPVVGPRLDGELRAWAATGERYGLDLSVPLAMSMNNAYVRRIEPQELLAAEGKIWDRIDLSVDGDANRSGRADWAVDAPTRVYGFAVWWEAEFGEGLSLSTGPEAAATHWEQLYFPLAEPVRADEGKSIRLELQSQSSPDTGTHLSWCGSLISGEGEVVARQEMDLDRGYLP